VRVRILTAGPDRAAVGRLPWLYRGNKQVVFPAVDVRDPRSIVEHAALCIVDDRPPHAIGMG
jgi:hypothetical protein